MRIGIHLGRFEWDGGPERIGTTVREIARTADAVGLDSLWLMDHLLQLGPQYGVLHGPADAPMLEGYAALSHLAAVTERIQLGLLVTCPVYRPPALLVKTVTTIDVLSGGRVSLGLGAGWYQREGLALGMPLPPLQERFERMEETLRIALQMWADDRTPFIGEHYQLLEPLNVPGPLRRPHPPIMIGGDGEKRTLPLVARFADAWNNVIGSPLTAADFGAHRATVDRQEYERQVRDRQLHKLDVLRRLCEEAGRPYRSIEKTLLTYLRIGPGGMPAPEVVELFRFYADLGFEHVILNIPDVDRITPLEVLGSEVLGPVADF